MAEEENWRELLKSLISDPRQRQHMAEIAGINPVTLLRWAAGKSKPRWENLQPILEAYPRYSKQFIAWLAAEYPQFFIDDQDAEKPTLEILSAFYSRVLKAYTSLPVQMRTSSICTLILNHMVDQLDPQHLGLVAVIVQCTPPTSEQKIRSLRTTLGRGTPPWPRQTEQGTLFLGAESQTGYAIISGHPVVIHSAHEKLHMFPTHHVFYEESAFTTPLMLDHRTAGCLYVASTQTDYFASEHYLELVRGYTRLITLAFDNESFYNPEVIDLHIMPPLEVQQVHIASFRQRVLKLMQESSNTDQRLASTQAEQMVWQQFEELLLKLPRRSMD
jgi:hypothetical protein